MEAYRYSPLVSPRTIRLLRLQPKSEDAKIRVSLEVFDLDNISLWYYPLSYAWGDPTPSEPIKCCGRELLITKNLIVALRHLQQEKVERMMWVDAICINQSDYAERSAQVAIMRDIYARGRVTIIWLGEGMDGDEQIFETIRTVFSKISGHQPTENVDSEIYDILVHPDNPNRNRYNNPLRTALSRLAGCAWFGRLWVVQEVVVSDRRLVVLGSQYMDWLEFEIAFGVIANLLDLLTVNLHLTKAQLNALASIGFVRTLFMKYHKIGTSEEVDLLNSLIQLSARTAKERHDRIYSVLGLVTEPNIHTITMDYSAPFAKAYLQAAKYCLLNNDSFQLLALAAVLSNEKEEDDQFQTSAGREISTAENESTTWPSWVPHFEVLKELTSARFTGTRYRYCSGRESKPIVSFSGLQDEELVVRGRRIDRIKIILRCQGWKPNMPVRMMIDERRPWLAACLDIIMQHDRYITGEQAADVAWRVMICDRLNEDRSFYNVSPTFEDQSLPQKLLTLLITSDLYPEESITKLDADYLRSHFYNVNNCTFFLTESGYVGWALPTCAVGDEVFLFSGSRTPFLLRNCRESKYQLISNAYVHGIMHGEAYTDELELHDVVIV